MRHNEYFNKNGKAKGQNKNYLKDVKEIYYIIFFNGNYEKNRYKNDINSFITIGKFNEKKIKSIKSQIKIKMRKNYFNNNSQI